MLSKGQMETKKYRFLGSSGGYAWIVTQATIVYDKNKPQSVVCVNYMIRWVGLSYLLRHTDMGASGVNRTNSPSSQGEVYEIPKSLPHIYNMCLHFARFLANFNINCAMLEVIQREGKSRWADYPKCIKLNARARRWIVQCGISWSTIRVVAT